MPCPVRWLITPHPPRARRDGEPHAAARPAPAGPRGGSAANPAATGDRPRTARGSPRPIALARPRSAATDLNGGQVSRSRLPRDAFVPCHDLGAFLDGKEAPGRSAWRWVRPGVPVVVAACLAIALTVQACRSRCKTLANRLAGALTTLERISLSDKAKSGFGRMRVAQEPRLRQIADELRQQIETGALGPGALLPSEPELARSYGVSRQTARAALQLLEREGLAIVRPRRGRIVRSNKRLTWNLSEFELPQNTGLASSDAWETT